MTIDRKKFYDSVRRNLFAGKITKGQLEGMEAILNEYEARGWSDLRWLAYLLATVYHEVAKTMQPIEEYGKGRNKTYGYKVKYSGKKYFTPDKIYYGRGLVQSTWYENYEKLTKANNKGWDFLNHPELLLQIDPSVWAAFQGMSTGLYTGKNLSQYFNKSTEDWINARRIINVLDKADLIAEYGKKFLVALV